MRRALSGAPARKQSSGGLQIPPLDRLGQIVANAAGGCLSTQGARLLFIFCDMKNEVIAEQPILILHLEQVHADRRQTLQA